MVDQQDNEVAVSDNATAQQFSVGAALRDAREQLGLSVADVANRIKFAPRQIEALETDDFSHLPEAAFVRGFVRSYARLLEIDATPLLAALPQTRLQPAAAPEKKSTEVPFPSVLTSRRSNIAWLAAGLVVAVVLIIFSRIHDSSSVSTRQAVQTNVETLELPSAAIAAASAPVADVPPAIPGSVAAKPVEPSPEAAVTMHAAQSSDKPANNGAAQEKAAQEKAAKTQAVLAQAALEQIAKEQATQEKIVKKQVALAQAAQEQAAKEQAAKERAAKKQAAQEQAAQEKAAKKQPSSEQSAQERAAKKQAALAPAAPKPDNAAPELAPLRLEFDEDSWVDVKDANGKTLLSRMNHAGSLVRLSGIPPLSVVIGHASGVHLFYRGKEVNLAPHTSVEVARVLLE